MIHGFQGFLIRRLIVSVPLVIAVLFVTFMLVRIGGQDPVALLAGPTASAAELAATKQALTARLDAIERDLRALAGV